jgi:hypothetical protein
VAPSPTSVAPLSPHQRPPPPGAPNARRSSSHGAPLLGSLSPHYVAIAYFNCFRKFRGMLQLKHMNVAKVDRGML